MVTQNPPHGSVAADGAEQQPSIVISLEQHEIILAEGGVALELTAESLILQLLHAGVAVLVRCSLTHHFLEKGF